MDTSRFKGLQATLSSRTPYCSGIWSVPALYFTLFYSNEDDVASRIDLSKATDAQLDSLSRACQPAAFGLGQKDVLDETYRKAGKIDLQHFSTHFNPTRAGIVQDINNQLLVGNQRVRLELYKLNVYEKEGFFKSHRDTPRGARMFGSLVVVFPTQHEGGELFLRQNGKEWVIDFSDAFKQSPKPCVGYVAFFSDIEHEVARVRSGYRVTLTYNLYFASAYSDVGVSRPLPNAVPPQQQRFKEALVELINSPAVLPRGGYLGFNLQHQYPIRTTTLLSTLSGYLKGSDAVLAEICSGLRLRWCLMVLYEVEEHSLVFDEIPNYPDESEDIIETMQDDGAQIINFVDSKSFLETNDAAPAEAGEQDSQKDDDDAAPILSLKDLSFPETNDAAPTEAGERDFPDNVSEATGEADDTDEGGSSYSQVSSEHTTKRDTSPVDFLNVTDVEPATLVNSEYLAYGNEARVGYIYGHVSLVVQLKAADKRKKLKVSM